MPKELTSAVVAEAVLAIWRHRPHQARFMGRQHKGAYPSGEDTGHWGSALNPAMQNARISQAVALAFLASGGGFMAAQAHCPHTDAIPSDTYHDGSVLGRPHPGSDHCHTVRTPPPMPASALLAMAQGSFRLPPPAPPALPDQQTTRQLGRQAPSAKLEQGALAKDAQPTLAMALASLPMPLDPGWDLSTSITTSGSVAVGLAHLVEEESLSVSFGVGTDWSHTQGVAVLSLSL